MQMNMHEAKSNLSYAVEVLENGRESVVYLARNGRTVAKLTAARSTSPEKRIGVARGKFLVPETIDGANVEVAALLVGEA